MSEQYYIQESEYNGSGNIYYVKAVSDVSLTDDATITKYPTTEGFDISDHAYNQPISLDLTLGLSTYNKNNGLYYYDGLNKIFLSYDESRDLVNNWKRNHILLNVKTPNSFYTNMVVSSYTFSSGDSLGFIEPKITLQEIRIASVETVTVEIVQAVDEQESANNSDEIDTGASVANVIGSIAGYATIGTVAGLAIGGPVGALVGGFLGVVVGGLAYVIREGD